LKRLTQNLNNKFSVPPNTMQREYDDERVLEIGEK
jgi:hypothetical protein